MRLALALLFFAPSLLAASLGGRATVAGAPRGGITVTASSEMLPKPRVTITASNGAYAIEELAPGTYDVTFSLAGHQTITRRAAVHAADRTRVDADLMPSEEGESVTLTAGARSVLHRPASVWSIDRVTAEHLPLGRSAGEPIGLAPRFIYEGRVDGLVAPDAPPADAVDETSVVIAGLPAELRTDTAFLTSPSPVILSGTVRETIEHWNGNTDAIHEASAGWRHLFAAVSLTEHRRSAYGKGTLAPTARDTVTAAVLTSEVTDELFGATWVHAREYGSLAATLSNELIATRSHAFVAGAHELAAGFERYDDATAWFLRDRWSIGSRSVIEAGVRRDGGELMPRLGAAFDVGGETRISATYARAPLLPLGGAPRGSGSIADRYALSAARPLGASGYARGTIESVDGELSGIVDGEWHWLLLRFGGAAQIHEHFTWANAWVMIDPPLPGHDVNVSLLERYFAGASFTDIAVNYALPRDRFTPFAHLDVVNVFERDVDRVWRVGLGLRF